MTNMVFEKGGNCVTALLGYINCNMLQNSCVHQRNCEHER